MSKTSKSKSPQKNKNNKTIPKNLEKKQYLESLAELKQSIKDNSQTLKIYNKLKFVILTDTLWPMRKK